MGWRAGALRKSAANGVAACCCLFLIAGALLAKNLDWLPDALICSSVLYLQYAWFTPSAAMLFSIGARHIEQRTHRKPWLIHSFVVLLAAFSTFRLADQQGWLLGDIGTAPAIIDDHGVVRQSSGSTCGAASCATLLRKLNIDPDATEAKMIPLCQTGRFGSTQLGMAVGLKSVAGPQGWRVQLLKCDWETFRKLDQPAVVSTQYAGIANHAVAILGFNDGGVQIADPLGGLVWWSDAEFKRVFSGEALVLHRRAP